VKIKRSNPRFTAVIAKSVFNPYFSLRITDITKGGIPLWRRITIFPSKGRERYLPNRYSHSSTTAGIKICLQNTEIRAGFRFNATPLGSILKPKEKTITGVMDAFTAVTKGFKKLAEWVSIKRPI
jgi:hypothetical protein